MNAPICLLIISMTALHGKGNGLTALTMPTPRTCSIYAERIVEQNENSEGTVSWSAWHKKPVHSSASVRIEAMCVCPN